jgi:hypothetical protein
MHSTNTDDAVMISLLPNENVQTFVSHLSRDF